MLKNQVNILLAHSLRLQCSAGKPFRRTLSGTSMWPSFRNVQHVQICGGLPLRIGDVALVLGEDGIAFAHRVIWIAKRRGETKYITKGDNSYVPDQLTSRLSSKNMLGKVIAVRYEDQTSKPVSRRLLLTACSLIEAKISGYIYSSSRRDKSTRLKKIDGWHERFFSIYALLDKYYAQKEVSGCIFPTA